MSLNNTPLLLQIDRISAIFPLELHTPRTSTTTSTDISTTISLPLCTTHSRRNRIHESQAPSIGTANVIRRPIADTDGSRESIMHDHRATTYSTSVLWHCCVVRQNCDFDGIVLFDGLDATEFVEGVEDGDGETVDCDGEEDEPVDDLSGVSIVCD